jgi:alginate O-acetyltransferase complex protein AlgI
MTFNSIEFGIFFPIVFLLYWLIFRKKIVYRNIFLIAVSYFFYGWWDWRFLSLLILSTFVDFYAGQKIEAAEGKNKRRWLLLSLTVNLGILTVFKYFGFFVNSFISGFSLAGIAFTSPTLHIILPVGLSFYTFQSLSYTLDVYYGRMKPTRSLIDFAAYISFFPQLVAGPIERARNLLPQFAEKREITYDMLRSGLLLMAFGLFKKIVLADRLARYVDASFGDLSKMDGVPLIVAVLFFALQLYLDFSAYSNIAIGAARMLGFTLSTNFNHPYFASSFSDFWKRWHISLSSWFRDYVYIPLGGNRKGRVLLIRNILVVFALSGLWHGASWNFVIWGTLNGLFLILFDRLLATNARGLRRIGQSVFVFGLWAMSLVFFRTQTVGDATTVFAQLLKPSSSSLYDHGLEPTEFRLAIMSLLIFFVFELLREHRPACYPWFAARPKALRWSAYFILVFAIIFLGSYGSGLKASHFIYFQF